MWLINLAYVNVGLSGTIGTNDARCYNLKFSKYRGRGNGPSSRSIVTYYTQLMNIIIH